MLADIILNLLDRAINLKEFITKTNAAHEAQIKIIIRYKRMMRWQAKIRKTKFRNRQIKITQYDFTQITFIKTNFSWSENEVWRNSAILQVILFVTHPYYILLQYNFLQIVFFMEGKKVFEIKTDFFWLNIVSCTIKILWNSFLNSKNMGEEVQIIIKHFLSSVKASHLSFDNPKISVRSVKLLKNK